MVQLIIGCLHGGDNLCGARKAHADPLFGSRGSVCAFFVWGWPACEHVLQSKKTQERKPLKEMEMFIMRLIDVCLAVYAPRFAAAARLSGWAIGLTLLLLTAHSPAAQVTLIWDASPSAAVVGYRLYYGTQSRMYTGSIDIGMATTYTITELLGGQTYYFAVTAYDRTGDAESAFADELSTTLPLPEEPASGGLIRLEAEVMALMGYRVESHRAASAGGLISRREALSAPPGVATAAFPGPAGAYDIIVSYFDERDGQSILTFTVNGEVMDTWVAHADLPDAGPGAVTLTSRVVATGVRLAPGDVIAVEGSDHAGEFARLDKVDFAPDRQ